MRRITEVNSRRSGVLVLHLFLSDYICFYLVYFFLGILTFLFLSSFFLGGGRY